MFARREAPCRHGPRSKESLYCLFCRRAVDPLRCVPTEAPGLWLQHVAVAFAVLACTEERLPTRLLVRLRSLLGDSATWLLSKARKSSMSMISVWPQYTGLAMLPRRMIAETWIVPLIMLLCCTRSHYHDSVSHPPGPYDLKLKTPIRLRIMGSACPALMLDRQLISTVKPEAPQHKCG